jgi:hypothetical protein
MVASGEWRMASGEWRVANDAVCRRGKRLTGAGVYGPISTLPEGTWERR